MCSPGGGLHLNKPCHRATIASPLANCSNSNDAVMER
jgi:hypothetical protein